MGHTKLRILARQLWKKLRGVGALSEPSLKVCSAILLSERMAHFDGLDFVEMLDAI